MQRLIPKSLFMRLFLLMAITLTLSQFLGMQLIFSVQSSPPLHSPPFGMLPPPMPMHNRPFDRPPQADDAHPAQTDNNAQDNSPPTGPGSQRPRPPFSPLSFMWAEMTSRLLAVLLVAWVSARWLSAPIKRMAETAEAFGKNLDSPAMELDGTIEVQQAAQALNKMRDKLKRQIKDRSNFMVAISHDLRTPLTRLQLRAEMMEPTPLQEKIRSDINEMSMLLTAAIDYLRGHTENETVQLVDIASMAQTIADDAVEYGKKASLSGTALPMYAHPVAMRRCLNNLVQNALKYGGCANISLQDSEYELLIEITDNGPGIDPKHLDDVFQAFFRVEGSRNRETGGIGLGLTIARDIVHLHGGELTLHNLQPKGLLVRLRLPRVLTS